MKTEIFKNYSEFLSRGDKTLNGVSQSFADENPTFSEMNESNKACWNCMSCSDCSSCSYCLYCSYCSYCSDCSYCSYCSDCSSCSYCSDCSYCSYCSDCSSCSYCSDCSYCLYCSKQKRVANTKGDATAFAVPIVENIHQRVYEAITQEPKLFDMGSWHNEEASCGTTHCRAGWVVHLAGESGYKLEEATSTVFAALQIYKASCPELPVSPYRFYETNELAANNIKEYAEKEEKLNKI